MKNLRVIAIVFMLIPLIYSYGQESAVLSQFTTFDIKSGKQVINEDITMKALVDEDFGLLPEDSLNYKYVDKVYQKRLVRLDLSAVQSTFPEVISITPEGDSILDYFSLIPLMMEAIQEQQVLIKDLQSRIPSPTEQTK